MMRARTYKHAHTCSSAAAAKCAPLWSLRNGKISVPNLHEGVFEHATLPLDHLQVVLDLGLPVDAFLQGPSSIFEHVEQREFDI